MGQSSKIEWTDNTFNPWWGCSRVSPACRFCYADTTASRWGHNLWRRHGDRRAMSDQYWRQPAKWNRDAERAGTPLKVFCASMADVFEDHPQVSPWRERLWEVIESTPWLIWQLLTKRIENVAGMVPWGDRWPRNVWIGTSVETQRFAEQRIPVLTSLTGAAVRFLSCEPLLGPLNLSPWMPRRFEREQGGYWLYGPECDVYGNGKKWASGPSISWAIAGGESGPKARPSHPAWIRSLRDQCATAEVPFFFKQWGEWTPYRSVLDEMSRPIHVWEDDLGPNGANTRVCRLGKKAAGRVLDGRTWSEFPPIKAPVAA